MRYKDKFNPPKHNPMVCTHKKCLSPNCKHKRKGHSFIKGTEKVLGCDDICDNNPNKTPCMSTVKYKTKPCERCEKPIRDGIHVKYCDDCKYLNKMDCNKRYKASQKEKEKEKVSA